MEALTAAATDRRAAWDRRAAAHEVLKTAIVAAYQGGAPMAEVTRVATEVHSRFGWDHARRAISRQAVHKILDEVRSGEGGNEEALLDAVRLAVVPTIEANVEYEVKVSELADQMWAARRAGVPATQVATQSGLAEKAAYEYLALQADWDALRAVVTPWGDADERRDDPRWTTVRHRGRALEILNADPDRAEELAEELEEAGFTVDIEALNAGRWTRLTRSSGAAQD